MRVAAVLRNAAKAAKGAEAAASAASSAAKPKPMSADPTLYHLESQGFWKKFHDTMVVNPEISSGLPLPDKNRYPQPGSRPERYATPATQASDIAFNEYHERDTRRAYPKTSVVTQGELSALLLSSPALKSLSSGETAIVTAENAPALTSVIEKLPAGRAHVAAGIQTAGADGLPPAPPTSRAGGKWVPKFGDEIPRPQFAYFPIVGYN